MFEATEPSVKARFHLRKTFTDQETPVSVTMNFISILRRYENAAPSS